jgi:hypothetical protein
LLRLPQFTIQILTDNQAESPEGAVRAAIADRIADNGDRLIESLLVGMMSTRPEMPMANVLRRLDAETSTADVVALVDAEKIAKHLTVVKVLNSFLSSSFAQCSDNPVMGTIAPEQAQPRPIIDTKGLITKYARREVPQISARLGIRMDRNKSSHRAQF